MKTIKTECSNVIRAENISTSQSEGRRGALRSKAGLLSSYWLVGGDGGGGGGAFSHFLLVIQSVRSSQSSKYIWSSRLCVFRQSTIVPSRGKGFWIRFVFNFPKTHIKFVFFSFIYLFILNVYLKFLKVQTIRTTTWVLVRVSAVPTRWRVATVCDFRKTLLNNRIQFM